MVDVKICAHCKQEKGLEAFRVEPNGYRRKTCKACKNKWVTKYRSVGAGKDCGGVFPPVCMDFDHVRGQKVGDISTMAGTGTALEKIQAEIAKCEVVCANCHRLRTATRKGHHA